MECLCPPPTPHSPLKPYTLFIFQSSRSCSPTPLNFSLSSPFLQPALAQCHLSLSPPPTPTPVIRSRGFHMKMTYLTGHISMCHSASDATLQIFWRGSAPILLFFFFFFFTLTAPPLPSNTTRFCIPVLNEKKKKAEGKTDR